MSTEHRSFVIVRRDVVPPAICFKCGTTDGLSLAPTHFYTTPDEDAATATASAAGVLVSAIGDAASIASLVTLVRGTREAVVPIPLCGSCSVRWKSAKRARLLAYVPLTLAIGSVFAFAFTTRGPLFPEGASRLALYAFVAAFTALLYGLAVVVPKWVERRDAEAATCGAVAIAPAWIALSRVDARACAALIKAAPVEARTMLER